MEKSDVLIGYLMDPVKGKILLEIQRKGTATAGSLCELCADIPRSTMYRHLSKMEKDGIVYVKDRVQKRGTVEKIYAINTELFDSVFNDADFDRDMLYLMYLKYCYTFMAEFRENLMACDTDDPKEIPLSFTTAPVYATDDELRYALMRIGGIIEGLMENKMAEGRRLFSVGVMVTPPKKV